MTRRSTRNLCASVEKRQLTLQSPLVKGNQRFLSWRAPSKKVKHRKLNSSPKLNKRNRTRLQQNKLWQRQFQSEKKDTESFAAEQADQKANIAAIDRALESLRKGTGGFLQSAAAKVVGRLMVDVELSNADRDALTDFLSQAHDAGYQRGSGQIVGILTDLKRIITKNLAEVMAAEERAQRDFERTTTPKSKELSTAAKLIEQKMARHGEVSMTIVTLREDLDDTTHLWNKTGNS